MELVKKGTDFVKKHRLICGGIGIFFVFLFIQLKYMYDVWFDPDELDIYTVAFEMVKGKVLYRDIPSQHMPWTYIISAFFYIIGAHAACVQRLYFYIMFAAFWTSFVFIYRKYVNKWVLILQPFVFFAILQQYDFTTQILSEHLAVIGADIFMLEFLMFLKKKDINLGSCIRMSIGVILSFGAAFINIFPLFYIGLGVLLLEIKWGMDNKEKMADWWKKMAIRYGRLFGVVAIPWVILVICMLATHSFHDFGYNAYTINRLYYPQYMNGLGGGIFSTFLSPITSFGQFITSFTTDGGVTPRYILEYFMMGSGIYMAYRIAKSDAVIAGLTIFFYTYSFAPRGVFNYHGTTMMGILALTTTYILVTYMYKNKEHFNKLNVLAKSFMCVMILLIVVHFTTDIQMCLSFIKGSEYNYYQIDTDIIEKITEKDERFWQTNVCDTIPWVTKRVTTGPTVSTPWMWDAIGVHKFDEFVNDPTRVVIFQLGYESWGNNMADYAPEAYYFIVNNYKFLPGSTQIWVANDYYEEACRKIGVDPATVENDNGYSCTPFNVHPSEMPGMTYDDRVRMLEEEARKAEEAANTDAENAPDAEAEEAEDKLKEEEKTEEPVTEEVTTEVPDESLDKEETGGVIAPPEDEGVSTDGPGESSDGGPGSVTVSPADDSRGPASVTVSPVEGAGQYYDSDGNLITEDTPGAVQAPDGSWVLPDDSAGPGSSSN